MTLYMDDQPAKGTRVPANEACLMTSRDGEDLIFMVPRLTKGSQMSGMATLLSAVLFRIKEDPEWLDDMQRYIEEEIPEIN